ncbi:hypothetical protein FRB95_001849 [Tulasnella sp. JGI-2019a]|nr:hypothetical protein FRB95_001849 [Tulasnella sp. JGI-2019a]
MERPAPALIHAAYNSIFHSPLTISKLKDAAIDGHLREATIGKQELYTDDNGHNVPGRSIAWKVFLIPQAPLTSGLSPSPTSPLNHLKESRSRYVELLQEKLRAPDGSYEEGFNFPGQDGSSAEIQYKAGNWEQNNPLSLDEKNPWQEWFTAMELRRTIAQDVERTFPDMLYFRQPHVQNALTTILFLHCSQHPQIGYRQGMHELLAPIFYVIDYDSVLPSSSSSTSPLSPSSSSPDAQEFCDRTWVNADSWCLFELVMSSAREWYEWREPPSTPGGVANGPMQTDQYVPPIVKICNSIQMEYLRPVDPALWVRLQEVGIEPQIYGIRWLRLLFSREFGMFDCLPLWDGIFAADPSLDIAKWICVTMLVRVRNDLIPADYSGQLTALLRYPRFSPGSTTPALTPQPTLLLRQALFVRSSPNPTAGVTIVMENRDLLGITFEAPEPPPLPTRRLNRMPPGAGVRGHAGGRPGGVSLDVRYTGGATTPGGSGGVLQDLIASRFNDVNSAVLSTVSELRRNLPELSLPELSSTLSQRSATSTPDLALSQSPHSFNQTGSGIGRRIAAGGESSSSSTRFELEREIVAMRSVQVKLGEALDWSLDVLQKPRHPGEEDEERMHAVECVAYVRDILTSGDVGPGLDEKKLAKWDAPKPPPVLADPVSSPEDSPTTLSSNQSPAMSLSARPAHTIAARTPNQRPGLSTGANVVMPSRTSPFSRYEAPSAAAPNALAHGALGRAGALSPIFHVRSPSQPLPDTQKQVKKGPAAASDPLGVL